MSNQQPTKGEAFFNNLLTKEGLSWMNKEKSIFKDHLPFYFNNYSSKERIKKVLEPVPLMSSEKVYERFFVLTKPSGSGKTTFALSLANLFSSTSKNAKKLEFYVISMKTPPKDLDTLMKETAIYIKNTPEDSFYQSADIPVFSNIVESNQKLGASAQDIPAPKGFLREILNEKNRFLIYFVDEFSFSDVNANSWEPFLQTITPNHRIGYLFASTDYWKNIRIGLGINSGEIGDNLLELEFLTHENIENGFLYFFGNLAPERIQFLKDFIFPFLKGRPVCLFLYSFSPKN